MVERNPQSLYARQVDASALKAFAHPLRMRLYDRLKDHGPATASMLARATGENTGQTSYHLRQLERHGAVSEVVGRGTARERWWQAEGISFGLEVAEQDPAALTSLEQVQRYQVHERARRQLEWIDRHEQEPREWLEATGFNELTTLMTAKEMADLGRAVAQVIAEHRERAKAARREDGEEGTRMVKLYISVFPLPEEEEDR